MRDALVTLVYRMSVPRYRQFFWWMLYGILPQIKLIREAYGFAVIHIHLKRLKKMS